jgi:hypothetical protein
MCPDIFDELKMRQPFLCTTLEEKRRGLRGKSDLNQVSVGPVKPSPALKECCVVTMHTVNNHTPD